MWSFLRLAVLGCLGTVVAQAPVAPQFRSRVDVLHVEVSVLDPSGQPVRDLQASDFTVTVDGRPRKVLFAQFSGAFADTATGPAAPLTARGTNIAAPAGRAVAFVVDVESLRSENEKLLLDTASRMVDSFGPNDAASLVPVPGTAIPLTRERSQVIESLQRLRGMSVTSASIRHFFTIDEAVAFERRDKRVIAEVIERECTKAEERARVMEGADPRCPPEVEGEARQRLLEVRAHTQALLGAIEQVAGTLARVDVPKTIVLVSAALPFDPESVTSFQHVDRTLRQAGVTLHGIHLDQPGTDASQRFRPGVESLVSRDQQSGLANLASVSGGTFVTVVGTAAGAFDRLRNEIAYSYDLGLEAAAEDANGGSRPITIDVRRPNVRVRARKELVVPPPVTGAAERLAQLMSQPFDVGQLPITAVVQTVRGEEAATVQSVLIADVARGVASDPPIRYALAVAQGGATVFQTDGTAPAKPDGVAQIVTSAQLKPGRYRLRIAAVDAAGRGGALEMPISAGIRRAGELQLSDVLVGTGDPFAPMLQLRAGDPLVSAIELYSAEPGRFQNAAVTFEVRTAPTAPPVATTAAALKATDAERRQIAQAILPTSQWPAGEYQVSAIVRAAGQIVGKVSGTIVIAPAVTPAATEDVTERTPESLALKVSDPSLEPVLHKLAAYVASYGEKASAIVATETYTQYLSSSGGSVRQQVVAEFALVKAQGPVGWLGYRDVVEVDGDAVRDRRDRLLKLVTGPSDPSTELRRISDESARFNMGPVIRNFNVPTTVLFFFHPANVSRFTFTKKGTRTLDGVATVEVAFKETQHPTMIMTRTGKDVPCEGTIWVRPDDGAVVRTRLRLRGFADAMSMGDVKAPTVTTNEYASPSSAGVAQAPSQSAGSTGSGTTSGGGSGGASGGTSGGGTSGGSGGQGSTPSGGSAGSSNVSAPGNARRPPSFTDLDLTRIESRADVEVTYQADRATGMWLPSKMTEEYEGPIPRVRRAPVMGSTRTVATYSDFKHFATAAKVKGEK